MLYLVYIQCWPEIELTKQMYMKPVANVYKISQNVYKISQNVYKISQNVYKISQNVYKYQCLVEIA